MSEIIIKCPLNDPVSIDDLTDIQGDVKDISPKEIEKMLNSMEKFGFLDPFDVWHEPLRKGEKKARIIVLGGNQRLKVVKRARELKYKLPAKFPTNVIKAKSMKEAVGMLTSMASTFGKTKEKPLLAFSKKFGLDIKEVATFSNFPEFNLFKENKEENNANSQKNLDKHSGGITVLRIALRDENAERADMLFESCHKKLKALYPETIFAKEDSFIFIMQHILDNYEDEQ